MLQNPDFGKDSFEDILSKDSRYAPQAYAFLLDVLRNLAEDPAPFDANDIMDEFRAYAIELWGPMAYLLLNEWGVKRCEDIGEMMFNLGDTGRIGDWGESKNECFINGFDFEEEFKIPYEEPLLP